MVELFTLIGDFMIFIILLLLIIILILFLIIFDLLYKNILLTNHNYDLISEIYYLKENL